MARLKEDFLYILSVSYIENAPWSPNTDFRECTFPGITALGPKDFVLAGGMKSVS